ncbi:MAG: hypothetical protein LLG45_08320 [Actinomycetia bacterium]|nr:hypothetical protein [Actinomycetes bacterium]
MFIREFLENVRLGLMHRRVGNAAVPEEFPLLRTLQFACESWNVTGADRTSEAGPAC